MFYKNEKGFCHYLRTNPTRIGEWFDREKHRRFAEILKSYGVKSLLDIGPGKGYLSNECFGMYYEAIDIDPYICEMMRIKGYICYHQEVPPLIVRFGRKYDAIICCSMIEHLKSPEKVEWLILDIRNHLNENGIVLIQSPELKYWRWYFWDNNIEHNFVTSRKRMEKLCINAGFEILLSEIWLDCFRNWTAIIIWLITRLVPPFGKVLTNIRHKYPCCVVVARKQ